MADVSAGSSREHWWPRIRRQKQVLASAPVVALLILVAALAPILATPHPHALNPRAKATPPGGVYLLGTDEFGRDIFSRLVYGARINARPFSSARVALSQLG